MVKTALGSKRICPGCKDTFYDLSRRPPVCPKCKFIMDLDSGTKPKTYKIKEPVTRDDVGSFSVNSDEENDLLLENVDRLEIEDEEDVVRFTNPSTAGLLMTEL